MAIKYIPAFEDKMIPGDWRVEAMNEHTGEVYIAIFTGVEAERRAAEYAAFKMGKLPAPKSAVATAAPAPVFGATPEFVIKTDNGHELLIRPDGLIWTYDKKREKISAWPKGPIELLSTNKTKEGK